MKKTKFFILLAAMIAVCALCAACGGNNGKTYKVSFDSNGGSEVPLQTVIEGKAAVEPKEPKKNNYVFDSWYLGEKPYDFTAKVNDDIELIASWIKADSLYSTVTFLMEDKSFTQTVMIGGKAIEPRTPQKKGSIFEGWYVNGEPFDFSAKITADLTLTARFKTLTAATVRFDTDGGNEIGDITVYTGDKVIRPDDPVRHLYKFIGWQNEDGTSYDFSAPVVGDLTLVAAWVSVFQFNSKTQTIVDAPAAEGRIEFPALIGGVPVLKLGEELFKDNEKITEVIIGGFISEIGRNAFNNCPNLSKVTFRAGDNPEALTIPASCFKDCRQLAEVKFEGQIKSISSEAFMNCRSLSAIDLTAVTNPQGVGSYAFAGTGLTAVNSASLQSFGTYAFYQCQNLSAVTLNEGFKTLDNYCLAETALSSLTLPASLTKLGDGCLSYTRINSITIPAAVSTLSVLVFTGCERLKTVDVAAANNSYAVFNNVLYNKKQTTLIYAPGFERTSLDIANTVTTINSGSLAQIAGVSRFAVVKGDYDTPLEVKVRAGEKGEQLELKSYSGWKLVTAAPAYSGKLTIAADVVDIDSGFTSSPNITEYAVSEGNDYFIKWGKILYLAGSKMSTSTSTAAKPLAFKLMAADKGNGEIAELMPETVTVGDKTIYATMNLSLSKLVFTDTGFSGIRFSALNFSNPNDKMFANLAGDFKVYIPAGQNDAFFAKITSANVKTQLNGRIVEEQTV